MDENAQVQRIYQMHSIDKSLQRIADALEERNKLLNDLIEYPLDMYEPPRIRVTMAAPVEIIK